MNLLPIARWGACAALLLAAGLSAHRLTGGFEHATHESLRQARAARGELRAAAVTLLDPHGSPLEPWSAAADRTGPGPAVTIVDFVYTRCETECTSLGTTFQQLQRWIADGPGAADGMALLSVSFDPAHDDGPALARYAARHGADPALWRVARAGSEAQTRDLLRSLGVVVIPDGQGGYAHNAALHLVDRQGRLRALVPPGEAPQALALARRLAREARP